ncbi:XylR family transcriptional regulator [Poriferisphaera sp. WC338]|uniref:XylR family transcriptional regulator n=1 Tax=Poriferisphaera sp. WC338 TaxID=3425129 RepID=UPI003D81B700
MSHHRRVALLIETSREYGRGNLRGIRRYIREHNPWSVFVQRRALESSPPDWLAHWQGDGILTRCNSQNMINAVKNLNLPTVELRPTSLHSNFPIVRTNDHAVGQIAAEHFIERGFRNYAVCFIKSTYHPHFQDRLTGFIEKIQSYGHSCDTYSISDPTEQSSDWLSQQNQLSNWLTSLPKPVGILAVTDQIGFNLLEACTRAELSVPDEVAVVGVEDDDLLCDISSPPLSSVRLNTERVGFCAAELLEKLMNGSTAPPPILIDPINVMTRQSSDIIAIDDIQIAKAIQLIRQRATSGLTVDELTQSLPISRSTLERRMRSILGRSPNHEILRIKLNHAKTLLSETTLPLESIAHKSGFSHVQYFCETFKNKFNQTPTAYRQQ